MDLSNPENNVILTKTESLTMGKPSAPKYARNKNILVIGGSGSGKTRFFVKPNLMQMHSSYVITDPKGTVLVECGHLLARGRPLRNSEGKIVYQRDGKNGLKKDKNGKPMPVYEPYNIKVFNTIDFSKSMHYNPFAYISERNREKDILKFVEVLIKNTSSSQQPGGDDFWVKAEKLLYTSYIALIFTLYDEDERNFETLIEMINGSECREEDETFKNAMDIQFGTAKKDGIVEKYNSPETSVVDKYNLQQQINTLSERIQSIDERIDKVHQPDEFYSMQDNNTLDAQMKLTSDKLADVAENGIETTSGLAEDTLFYAQETEELDKSQIASLADKFNLTVEEQLEDDYNMIDGIINNGSKADLEKTRADLAESIEAAQTIADNPHIRQEMREMANEDIARLQGELAVVEKALSSLDAVNEERTYEEEVSEVSDWLLDMVADGKAEMSEDGAFRVNPDYYKELPRNDRHIESMTEAQAVSVMAALSNAGIEFSAAARGDDKVGITVSKKDLVALNDIMYSTIGKIAKTQAAKENAGKGEKGKYQTINPEYYASLSKEQRHSRVEATEVAREIVKGLMAEKIPYSAVVRKNDTVAITVNSIVSRRLSMIFSVMKFRPKRLLLSSQRKSIMSLLSLRESPTALNFSSAILRTAKTAGLPKAVC